MKRKVNIADFFVKKHKSDPDQAQTDSSHETSSPGSSQPEASQASQCGQTQGPSLPPPGQSIQKQLNASQFYRSVA